ncbi:hypothetical protein PUMCH_005159 [Australozyma saopauloensis]|uniref:Pre-rRNA-processing protein IPI3 n=1 Tax=Australozyma saopauloensis TaxID=291208 RepID=A0AAX4HGY3_9ASCO|nr:hypothetical protein PUMCH_005159 [[Candida] saopauloensis]
MDEIAIYVTRGNAADKHAQESLGSAASIQSEGHYASFRNAECPINGGALTGFGPGERLFVASPNKALITTYAWGKESADQRFPVPEPLSCLTLAKYPPGTGIYHDSGNIDEKDDELDASSIEKPSYSTPWLLAAGSKSGRLYIWELALGDLVCVKDAHYQEISSISFSKCGTFLVTGGLDTRIHVWDTLSLVTPALLTGCKPFATFSNHSLQVTQIEIYSAALVSDFKVYSSSKDGTVCIYDILSKSLLTTFVLPCAVECFARDPAGRTIYAGLADGTVRLVPLYVVNPHSNILEAVGGSGKVVTVEADPNLTSTFVHHVSTSNEGALNKDLADKSPLCHPTVMRVSMDGMQLISGDSCGQTFVADIVTKQVVKAFTACKSPIAYLSVDVCDKKALMAQTFFEKKHRLLPPLKRILVSVDPLQHSLTMQLSGATETEESFELWLQQKANEEFEFTKASFAPSTAASTDIKNDEAVQLQLKLDKVSAAYNELKDQYEELLAAHEQ